MTHPNTRPDMAQLPDAHNCKMLYRLNAQLKARRRRDQARARYVLAALCFALGMALAGLAYSNAYARAADAVANPHHEGF